MSDSLYAPEKQAKGGQRVERLPCAFPQGLDLAGRVLNLVSSPQHFEAQRPGESARSIDSWPAPQNIVQCRAFHWNLTSNRTLP